MFNYSTIPIIGLLNEDGEQHQRIKNQIHDLLRTSRLNNLGIKLIRISIKELNENLIEVINLIKYATHTFQV